MWTGLKMFGGWIKMHPVWAAILFLVIIPFLLLGVFTRVRGIVAGLPVVGSLATQVGAAGDKLAGKGA